MMWEEYTQRILDQQVLIDNNLCDGCSEVLPIHWISDICFECDPIQILDTYNIFRKDIET